MTRFRVINKKPSLKDYMFLRKETLGSKTKKNAKIALKHTWHGVYIVYEGKTVGMGRIIGDCGVSFVLTDVCVLEEHRQCGVGNLIMKSLLDYYKLNAPSDAYFILLATGDAKYLYKKYGFYEKPGTTGMLFNNQN